MRILLLSNIPTPYQIDFWSTVAEKDEVRAVFLWAKDVNRDWNSRYPSWVRILDYQAPASGWTELQKILEEFRPDAIVVGGYRLPLAQQTRRYASRHRTRFFYWLEKPLPHRGIKVLLRVIVRWLTLPFADGVLCIGREAQRIYQKQAKRTLYLPYSIKLSRYPLREQTPARLPLKCLYVGQYIPRKGIPELLGAFADIAPQSATLTLAGSGELKPLIADYTRRHTHITDIGFSEPEKLPSLLAEHDVLLVPSRHDGWAVVVAEAMAVGLPVISTSHTTAYVDIAASYPCGRTCEVTADSIRQAVDYYIAHPDEVRRQGHAGREVLQQSAGIAENAASALVDFITTVPV